MATVTDLREQLPQAIKSGTTHKPQWTIDGVTYKFVQPVNRFGLTAAQKKVRLGNRKLAKYKAGATKTGEDLVFVGIFAKQE